MLSLSRNLSVARMVEFGSTVLIGEDFAGAADEMTSYTVYSIAPVDRFGSVCKQGDDNNNLSGTVTLMGRTYTSPV